jgi:type II restriction/modification system DNA methylase subunit YeeA
VAHRCEASSGCTTAPCYSYIRFTGIQTFRLRNGNRGTGEWFTFEKGATKSGGGEGFADVWKKNFFAWEYKKKKRDLNAAMDQLVRYAAALENPPLQVVCDTDRFIIRTAWTNAVPKQYEIELDDLSDPKQLSILRAVFHDPESLHPKETRAGVTKEAADKFSTIASRLQGRGTPEEVAHFVNQLVFCFFANSVKLLPEGFLPKLLKRAEQRLDKAQEYFNALFEAMENGGEFDLTDIAHFNGGLFDGRRAIQLDGGDIGLLVEAGSPLCMRSHSARNGRRMTGSTIIMIFSRSV